MKKIASYFLVAVLLSGCAALNAGSAEPSEIAALREGMTKQKVVDKLGNPWEINRSNYGDYTRTQFVYKEYGSAYEYLYVYFENGYLTSTQY